MPYTPPGIEVIQDLDVSAVSTSSPAQPVVVIGPAFQIVTDEAMGTYTGLSLVASYASAGVVDIREPDADALASENYAVDLGLEDVIVETLSETDMGGAHLTPVGVDGVAATWNAIDTDLVIGYTAADDANAALIQPGDFVSFSAPAAAVGIWFVVDAIDTTAKTLSWVGTAWNYGAMAAGVITVRRPAIPDSIQPGASTWQDTSANYPALGVAVGDSLRVSRPSTFAGTSSSVSTSATSVQTCVGPLAEEVP